ncbi:hypothetical protein H2203_003724 [Taxawa tesnikishii (nom. ined.)]|nr:hypothetical protein H2203_003724 [Dothideales sp. JES 119]
MRSFILAALGLPVLRLVAADQSTYQSSSEYQQRDYGLYPNQTFTSVNITAPIFNVNTNQTEDAHLASQVFLSVRGTAVQTAGYVSPMVFNSNDLSLVWANSTYGQCFGTRIQQYNGSDYLTFWSGKPQGQGYGEGTYIMLDNSYNVAYNLTAKNVSVQGDMHEFQLTDNGTALITVYEPVSWDLSAYNISNGWIVDSLFQEIDIATNDLIFSWRASDHFALNSSYAAPGSTGDAQDNPYDFYHINSVEKDDSGNYLISARHTHTISYVNGSTGDLIWVLGGKENQFEDQSNGDATNFAWQHDARWFNNTSNQLTLFDNGAADWVSTENATRGLRITLDYSAMTATLDQAYMSPDGILSASQGSVQPLANGNVLMGYGNNPAFTEYTPDGTVVWDVQFGIIGNASVQSYRAYKQNWTAYPSWDPAIAARDGSVFVSWNGATEVKSWALLAGNESAGALNNGTALWKNVTKDGFETGVDVAGQARYVRAVALDNEGKVLGASDVTTRASNGTVDLGSGFATRTGSGDDSQQDNATASGTATSTSTSSTASATQSGAAGVVKVPTLGLGVLGALMALAL